jgi:hypothetical protein
MSRRTEPPNPSVVVWTILGLEAKPVDPATQPTATRPTGRATLLLRARLADRILAEAVVLSPS